MAFDDGDKAFIKLAVMEGFQTHYENEHKPLEQKMEKLSLKISYWAGGLAAIVLILGLVIEAHK